MSNSDKRVRFQVSSNKSKIDKEKYNWRKNEQEEESKENAFASQKRKIDSVGRKSLGELTNINEPKRARVFNLHTDQSTSTDIATPVLEASTNSQVPLKQFVSRWDKDKTGKIYLPHSQSALRPRPPFGFAAEDDANLPQLLKQLDEPRLVVEHLELKKFYDNIKNRQASCKKLQEQLGSESDNKLVVNEFKPNGSNRESSCEEFKEIQEIIDSERYSWLREIEADNSDKLCTTLEEFKEIFTREFNKHFCENFLLTMKQTS